MKPLVDAAARRPHRRVVTRRVLRELAERDPGRLVREAALVVRERGFVELLSEKQGL